MFRRKFKATFWERLKTFLRTFYNFRLYCRYIFFKLSRSGDSDHRIACGLASGIAISLTPFVGFHFVLSMIIAKIFRGSPIAAAIGTAFGNPITFPFIWVTIYKTGLYMMPSFSEGSTHLQLWEFFTEMKHCILELDAQRFVDSIYPVFFPMLIGSIPYYIIFFFGSYFLIIGLLKEYRQAKSDLKGKEKLKQNAKKAKK